MILRALFTSSYSMKIFLCVSLHLFTFNIHAEQFDLFIMAGQSNMQGWRSDASQYPPDRHQLDSKIPFYFKALDYSSSNDNWQQLGSQLGHFKQGHFGPEITFARAIKKLKMNPAIFKYSSGSSSIKMQWKGPGHRGQYDDMIQHLKKAIQQLQDQGHTVIPRAFIWIQGESDANSRQLAQEYYWHLKKMLTHLRNNTLRNPSLPVILSVDEQHPRVQLRPEVVNAQIQLSLEDNTISFVSMYGLEKSDVTHLTAKGTIEQGKRLFQSYIHNHRH